MQCISASKRVGSGEILIWDLDKHIKAVTPRKKMVPISPLARLQYPDTLVKYINLGYASGNKLFVDIDMKHLLF